MEKKLFCLDVLVFVFCLYICLHAYLCGERSVEGLLDGLTLIALVYGAWSANHFRGEDCSWRVVDNSLAWNYTDEMLLSKLSVLVYVSFLRMSGNLLDHRSKREHSQLQQHPRCHF